MAIEATRKIIHLADRIYKGRISRTNVEKELCRIETQHNKPFSIYAVTRKEKPWDMKYLKELHQRVTFGAASRDFLSYMSEVAGNVYRKRRIAELVGGIVAIITIVAIIMRMLKKI